VVGKVVGVSWRGIAGARGLLFLFLVRRRNGREIAQSYLPSGRRQLPAIELFCLAIRLLMIENTIAFYGSERKKLSHLKVVGWGGKIVSHMSYDNVSRIRNSDRWEC